MKNQKVMMRLSSTVEWRNRRKLLTVSRTKCVGELFIKDMPAFASNYCPAHSSYCHIPSSTIESVHIDP